MKINLVRCRDFFLELEGVLKSVCFRKGRSLITTTQRYVHVSPPLLKNTCNQAHPRF